MKRIVTVSSMMLFLAVAATKPAYSQTDTAAITGVVKNTSGNVVPGVTVLISSIDGEPVTKVVTDTDGKYKVSGLKPGRYSVHTAVSAGGSSIRIWLPILASGATEQLNITVYASSGASTHHAGSIVIHPRGDKIYK